VLSVTHKVNRGKGAALRTGFRAALSDGAEIILVQDGDLEYTPADHADVLAPILDGRADVVVGTRFKGQTHRVLYFWHSVANQVITLLSNMLTNLNLSDVECCFKAMTREVAERIEIRENRFGVEPELVAKVARMRLEGSRGKRQVRVFEVPISYAGRTYAEGKKIGWKDGVRAIWCILKYNLLSRRG
jgi:glycosyltransferase involved in cell wall biosynthesis